MTDWPDLLEPVARELLGEPSRRTTSGEWRYGRKGSLAVHVAGHRAGTWRDHEADAGGGVLDLLEHVEGIDRAEALVWLRRRGLLDGAQPPGDAASRLAGAGVARHRGPPDNRSAGTLARCSAPASPRPPPVCAGAVFAWHHLRQSDPVRPMRRAGGDRRDGALIMSGEA